MLLSSAVIDCQAGGAHFFAEDGGELSPEEQKRLETQSLQSKRGHVAVQATYLVHADGSLQCRWQIDASNALPAMLPPGLYKWDVPAFKKVTRNVVASDHQA